MVQPSKARYSTFVLALVLILLCWLPSIRGLVPPGGHHTTASSRRGRQQQGTALRDSPQQQDGGLNRVVGRLDELIDSISNSSLPIVHGAARGLFVYANTTQVKTLSLEGLLFLATNVPFVLAAQTLRSTLTQSGQTDIGLATLATSLDVSAVLSFFYHFTQMELGPNRNEVKRFLFADYISALVTCTIVTLEVLPFLSSFDQAGIGTIKVLPVVVGLLALSSLAQSWRFDQGRKYLLWHGLWHVLSAYTCVLLAQG